MNELEVLAVFAAFIAGAILLALFVVYLDRQDRRSQAAIVDVEHGVRPAE